MRNYDVKFSALIGKTITSINGADDSHLRIKTSDGKEYRMFHSQDCCESVYLEDVVGDWNDLIGSPVVRAEESSSDEPPEGRNPDVYRGDSEQWTFYRITTAKGLVVLRWYGSSNGYYSTSVDFQEV